MAVLRKDRISIKIRGKANLRTTTVTLHLDQMINLVTSTMLWLIKIRIEDTISTLVRTTKVRIATTAILLQVRISRIQIRVMDEDMTVTLLQGQEIRITTGAKHPVTTRTTDKEEAMTGTGIMKTEGINTDTKMTTEEAEDQVIAEAVAVANLGTKAMDIRMAQEKVREEWITDNCSNLRKW